MDETENSTPKRSSSSVFVRGLHNEVCYSVKRKSGVACEDPGEGSLRFESGLTFLLMAAWIPRWGPRSRRFDRHIRMRENAARKSIFTYLCELRSISRMI